ncbi:Rrf2 family transcriptional regulator [Pseudoxanthomonas putridarboris]|uniref:Rrf2 family transcriptional regulator n=1 Tax=Pseudoxanthomonas putridarboris TaxID=752605 RepID=A0ABU9IZ95_9GAMM
MKSDDRLSAVLHVLLHMAQVDGPMTSDQIARMMHTHPVVVRRTLAGLRELGWVQSAKGHGGGWKLACDLDRTTLLDVHRALGTPSLLKMNPLNERPECAVQQAVNVALNGVMRDAEALLAARLGEVTLADLAADFRQHMAAHPFPAAKRTHGH